MSCTSDLFLKSVRALLSEFANAVGPVETFDTLLLAELVGGEVFAASIISIRLSVEVGLDSVAYPVVWTDPELSRRSTAASYGSPLRYLCILRGGVLKPSGELLLASTMRQAYDFSESS